MTYDIFIDKIKLSAMIIEKEGYMIGKYNQVLRDYRAGYVNDITIKTDRVYLDVITTIKELWDIQKYNKIEELKKIYTTEFSNLNEIMKIINDPLEVPNFEKTTVAYEMILFFIARGGYHNDLVPGDSNIDEEPENF